MSAGAGLLGGDFCAAIAEVVRRLALAWQAIVIPSAAFNHLP